MLARTYRPQRLSELIGQDALVRTLSNALRTGRIAHAFLLTGIRGVGKTTTARIIARALNCIGPDGKGQPTPEPCGVCEPCVAIAEGRHIDVLEMDAATRTGIDDIREIVDSVRYAPTSARYKVYIIDEVHMLSEKAFNGLLKTLEEPPPQTIFIFATTEVRKVPVTVLSRCQRFDLRRVEGELLQPPSRRASPQSERVQIEPGALALIVRAAEGSVRDGLSLLDQAITLLGGDGAAITGGQVQDMLGLADRGRVLDLFEHGDARRDQGRARTGWRELYDLGTEPEAVLQDLLEISHWLTRIKVAPEAAEAFGVSPAGRCRARPGAGRSGSAMPVLARTWQMLLKGLEDVRRRPSRCSPPRWCWSASPTSPTCRRRRSWRRCSSRRAAAGTPAAAASRPVPAEVARRISWRRSTPRSRAGADGAARRRGARAAAAETFAEAVALFGGSASRCCTAGCMTRRRSWCTSSPAGSSCELRRADAARPGTGRVAAALGRWTGGAWLVSVGGERPAGAPTLAEQAAAEQQARIDALAERPADQADPGAVSRGPGSSTCARQRPRLSPITNRGADHEEPRQHAEGSPEAAEQDGRHAGQARARSRSPARPAAAWSP